MIVSLSQVEEKHVHRLFDIADADGQGDIDYEEFVHKFAPSGDVLSKPRVRGKQLDLLIRRQCIRLQVQSDTLPLRPHAQEKSEPTPEITQTMRGVSQSEVDQVLRKPLVQRLRTRLYQKGDSAKPVFRRYDVDGDGCLSVETLTKCCETLVTGVVGKGRGTPFRERSSVSLPLSQTLCN